MENNRLTVTKRHTRVDESTEPQLHLQREREREIDVEIIRLC